MTKQTKRFTLDQLQSLIDVALHAVGHVAMANYADREREAYAMINEEYARILRGGTRADRKALDHAYR